MMSKDPTSTALPGQSKVRFETTAQAFLELLSLRGIDYFFANAGTDFASIVDAFAFRQHRGDNFPRPITVPHETPLISMAHGYYMLTGKPQAAMVHVGIGTANGLGAFVAGSNTVSNMMFSLFQFNVGTEIGVKDPTWIVALQAVGGAAGNKQETGKQDQSFHCHLLIAAAAHPVEEAELVIIKQNQY